MQRTSGQARHRESRKRLRRVAEGLTGIAVAVASVGSASWAQTPPTVSWFVDSLDPTSVTSLGTGGYTKESNYGVNSIVTTSELIDSRYTSTSHTWTSINDSYVPTGLSAPGLNFGAANANVAFGSIDYPITNSDGRTSSASGNGNDALVYEDYYNSQPSSQANSTTYGVQSVFLVSPLITVQNGSVISFWTKGSGNFSGAYGGDRLKLLFSSSSSSNFDIGTYTPTGSTTGSAGGQATYTGGDFSKNLLDINPGYIRDGTAPISTGTTTASSSYPTSWTQYNITMSGLSTSGNNPKGAVTGRFAFQYFVTHANVYSDDGYGNDIEIDDFTANLPEPSALPLLLVAGAPVWLRLRRRRRVA